MRTVLSRNQSFTNHVADCTFGIPVHITVYWGRKVVGGKVRRGGGGVSILHRHTGLLLVVVVCIDEARMQK